ncbi:hypothetical protein FHR38_001103 [Micromonospora polyrhachis]|uniref:Uncharacterized protein n=1 Tax=Micromonospora polyrhachis TaxID=1282883 RepID=A0A7W7SMA8_9ACTN|nr:hypothetical protein [Micromonospora polyrhachis]
MGPETSTTGNGPPDRLHFLLGERMREAMWAEGT